MSELNIYKELEDYEAYGHDTPTEMYDKNEADKVIAEKDKEIAELKNRIAPKQSDKPLQERLNEVCKKHAVSTLQDLDWAFCMAEARLEDYTKLAAKYHEALEKMLQYKVLYKEKCRDINTQERFFAMKVPHEKYKRCLALADYAEAESCYHATLANGFWLLRNDLKKRDDERRIAKRWDKWHERWLAIAEKFEEAK